MRFKALACVLLAVGALASACGGGKASFSVAVPVWPEGRERRMNDFVEFRAPDGWHMIAEQDVDCKNL